MLSQGTGSMNFLFLAGGLVLLVGGADLLVRGVSALARAAGVPALLIGLTVVAFGTSLPEVMLNTRAAINNEQQQLGLAFGNIVGASALNIGFVLAIAALVRPLKVQRSIIVREIPMMILAAAALLVLSCDVAIDRAAADVLGRSNGIILLLFFCVFLYYVIQDALKGTGDPPLNGDALTAEVRQNISAGQGLGSEAAMKTSLTMSVLLAIVGFMGVGIGSKLAIDGAVGLASALGVPSVIIGLTIVSIGTTLPELATSVVATRRGQSEIAIGNVVGSNIFNMLFIGGLVPTIRPLPIPPGGKLDLIFLMALCLILLPVAIRGPRMITRAEGAFLLCGYVAYMTWRTLGAL